MLTEQGISLEVDEKTIEYLVENGYNDEYGARPLRRLIQKELDNVFSSMIIRGDLLPGETLRVTSGKSGLEVTVDKNADVPSKRKN